MYEEVDVIGRNYEYSQAAPCASRIPAGPVVQYFCDLDTTISSTITFPPTPTSLGYNNYITLTGSDTSKMTDMVNVVEAGGIRFVSGFVGTGPWTTASSTTSRYGGYWSGGDDSSSSSYDSPSEIHAASVRKKTTKIAVGAAVPVGVALLAALILFCKKRGKKAKTTPPLLSSVQSPAPLVGVGEVGAQPYLAPTNVTQPPAYGNEKQEPIVGVSDRTSQLAQLEADNVRV